HDQVTADQVEKAIDRRTGVLDADPHRAADSHLLVALGRRGGRLDDLRRRRARPRRWRSRDVRRFFVAGHQRASTYVRGTRLDIPQVTSYSDRPAHSPYSALLIVIPPLALPSSTAASPTAA